MDPNEAGGGEKEKEKEKEKVIKRRNRPVFLRYLERRKTDTIVAEDTAKGDINLGTLVRRSQSDKTEYSAKLKGTPHNDLPRGQNYGNNLYTREPTQVNSLHCKVVITHSIGELLDKYVLCKSRICGLRATIQHRVCTSLQLWVPGTCCVTMC